MIDQLVDKYLGNNKIVFFDVGAKGGTRDLNKLAPYIKIYAFEPNPYEFLKLQLQNGQTVAYNEMHNFQLALSDHKGTTEFYITNKPSYSSLLKYDEDSFERHLGLMKLYQQWENDFEIKEVIQVETTSIDAFCNEHRLDDIDFLKLDTQGSELMILQGSKQLLQKIGVLKCEVNFVKAYKGQSLFSDIDLFLRQRGFEFVDCLFYPDTVHDVPSTWKKQSLADRPRYSGGGDAIYMNTNFSDKIQTIKAGLILAESGYLSEALSCLKGHLSQHDLEAVIRYLSKKTVLERVKEIAKDWLPPKIQTFLKRSFVRKEK